MTEMTTSPKVFISYARQDGEDFARQLRLKFEEIGLAVWQDRTQMGGGDWWEQITDALDQSDVMVLVATPKAMESEVVRDEWRYARQQGVWIYPVLVPGNPPDFQQMPRWMKSLHFYDYSHPEQHTRFLQDLQHINGRPSKVPFMVDEKPTDFVDRPEEFDALLGQLLDKQRENPVAITAALKGAGGYGKTTLAKAICHDDKIRQAFDDGILWVTLGEDPKDLIVYITDLIRTLTNEAIGFGTLDAAQTHLRQLLDEQDVLLVVDDVWKPEHLKPFLNLGKRCALLVTTRYETTLPPDAVRVQVDAMGPDEALQLLCAELDTPNDTKPVQLLVKRLGKWPLLLKLANGVLRRRVERGQSFSDALHYVETALDKHGLTFFNQRNSDDRNAAVAKTLNVTFDLLQPDEYARYQELAIFPEDVDIPLDVVARLWGATGDLDAFDTEQLCEILHDLSLLLKFDPAARLVRLHDVIRTYLISLIPSANSKDTPTLQRQFLDAYNQSDWAYLPETESYLWQHLAYHLTKSNQQEVLRSLLLNPEWLEHKLAYTSPNTLLVDFDYLVDDSAVKLVEAAVRMSAHILGEQKTMLRGQLYGRLLAQRDHHADIANLLVVIQREITTSTLFPLLPTLDQAGTALEQVIDISGGFVNALTLTPDNQFVAATIGYDVRSVQRESAIVAARHIPASSRIIVSSSYQSNERSKYDNLGVVKIFNLATGLEVRSFEIHQKAINTLLISSDGNYGFSASEDGTAKMWSAETGQTGRVFAHDSTPVRVAALSPDSKWLATGLTDGVVCLWEVESGELLRVLDEHDDVVQGLQFVDHDRLVSASRDRTLRLWSLTTGECIRVFGGHTGFVTAVAVSPDGQAIFSCSWDKTIRMWDVNTGECLRVFRGHSREVTSAAVTPDGQYLLSGAWDNAIKLWHIETGSEIAQFIDHNYVTSLAVDSEGRFVLSGSYANTIRRWRLEHTDSAYTYNAHTNRVHAIAAHPASKKYVTASWDGTLKLWDSQSHELLQHFIGHTGAVASVAFSPDGRFIVSGGSDIVVRIWDVDSGDEIKQIRLQKEEYVNAIDIGQDGRVVITGTRSAILGAWQFDNGEPIKTIGQHNRGIRALSVTQSGRVVVLTSGMEFPGVDRPGGSGRAALRQEMLQSIDKETRLEIYDYATGEKQQTISVGDVIFCFAHTPDETLLVTASWYEKIRVWDMTNGELLNTLTGHTWIIEGVCISSDGKLIFSVAQDRTARVWNSQTGDCISIFNLDENLTSCALLPDDRTLIVGGESGRIHILRLEEPDLSMPM